MLNKKLNIYTAVILASAVIAGCNDSNNDKSPSNTTTQPLPIVNAAPPSPSNVKNMIVMSGDGMGPQQLGLLQDFANHSNEATKPNGIYHNKKTGIAMFSDSGHLALSSTGPYNNLVVDSACSATQLATGKPALSEVVGLDIEGNPTETILEVAKRMGKATGLITDTRITHATPAAFAAHQRHRSLENEIAVDMLNTDVDVMLGGGLRYWIPQGSNSDSSELVTLINEPSIKIKSKRKDDKNLLLDAKNNGYKLAFNKEQMASSDGDKLLGIFAYSGMLDGIAYSTCKENNNCVQPSLAEMTKKALDILSKDEDGFFLMIEGGQIDWAAHNNDAGTMLHQMLHFDESVQAVYDWVKDRDDTLVVITADHETGGFGFSYSRKNLPAAQRIAGSAFFDETNTPVDYKPNFNFASYSILDGLYNQKKSYIDIWDEAGGDLADIQPTAQDLMDAMNANTEFVISIDEAEDILERETNHYHVAGHKYLNASDMPKVDDFEAFYVYGEEIYLDLMGRALAKHQNTVWSTGTHTNTPVSVISWGPKQSTNKFTGLMNHVEVGAQLMTVIKN
jgi:alkaline phosphatase